MYKYMQGQFSTAAEAWRSLALEFEELARHITSDTTAHLSSGSAASSDFHVDSPIPPPPADGHKDPYRNLRRAYGTVSVTHAAPAMPESPLGTGWWAHQERQDRQEQPMAQQPRHRHAVGARWRESPDEAMARSGVAVVDRCVSPRALASLRAFLAHSTVWRSSLAGGYLGAYQQHHFTPAVLLQLGAAIKRVLPNTLGPHRIQRMWSYKYANFGNGTKGGDGAGGEGGDGYGVSGVNGEHVLSYNDGKGPMISAHSDPSTITINLW